MAYGINEILHKDAALNQNDGIDQPSASMLPAIFGLVGVILGALIASGTSYWLETRKEKREREKESRKRASMIRQAARLVDEEFLAASNSVLFAAEMKRWGDVLIFKLTTIAWEKYHTVLAMELSTSVWDTVLFAHIAVKQLIDLRAMDTISDDPDDPRKLPNAVLEIAERFRRDIEKGRAALAAFSASEPP